MNETCDRCGPAVRAAYRTARGGQLYLCQHGTAQLSPALRAQGWTIFPAGHNSLSGRAVRSRCRRLTQEEADDVTTSRHSAWQPVGRTGPRQSRSRSVRFLIYAERARDEIGPVA